MRTTRLGRDRLLALIEAAYAAAEDARLWQPLLAALSGALGASGACLLAHDLVDTGSAIVMAGFDPEAMRLYNEHFHKVDAWAPSPNAPWLSQLDTVTDEAVTERAILLKTEFYSFLKAYGISRMIHTTLKLERQGVAGLSIYRRETDTPFGVAETRFVKALAPHLRRALRIHELMADARHERQTAVDGLDASACGVLLVAHDGRVLHANHTAESILAMQDGLSLDRALLIGSTPGVTSTLRRLSEACGRTTSGEGTSAGEALAIPRPSGRRALQVLVSPAKRIDALGLQSHGVAAIVFVSDPERHSLPSTRVLQALYGLTPAEATVAAHIGAGLTVEEIAGACGYTRQTVQWYNKQILSKMGCRNRAALVWQLSVTLASLAVAPVTP